MYYETPSEEMKNKLIDNIANFFINKGLDNEAILFFDSFKSLGYVASQLGLVYFAAILMTFGRDSEKIGYQSIRLFEEKKNIEELIQRIKALQEEKNISRIEKHKLEKKEIAVEKNYLLRMWNFLITKIKPRSEN